MNLKRWPEITAEDKAAVLAVLDSGQLYGGLGGGVVDELEEAFAAYTDMPYCVAMSSCTAAIHTALSYARDVLGTKQVFVPAFTFGGTVHPVLQAGLEPIFVDVDKATFSMSLDSLNLEFNRHRSLVQNPVILPVHMHGRALEMDDLVKFLVMTDGILIEDACQAPGAEYLGRKAGTYGAAGCFSLSLSKPITGGQGGLLVTRSQHLYQYARSFRSYGERPGETHLGFRTFKAYDLGYNYAMPSLAAALALSQLRRLDMYVEQAQANAEILEEVLGDIPYFILPQPAAQGTHNYHKYRILLKGDTLSPSSIRRDRIVLRLREAGIPAALWGVMPVSEYPLYDSSAAFVAEVPNSKEIFDNSFILFDESHSLAVQTESAVREVANLLKHLTESEKEVFE